MRGQKPEPTSSRQEPLTHPRGLHGGHGPQRAKGLLRGPRDKWRDTHPDYGAVTLAGHQQETVPRGWRKGGRERALPCLQGALGVQLAPFPTRVRRSGSRPPYRGPQSPGQPKGARRQKANYSKRPEPWLQGQVAQHRAGRRRQRSTVM